MENVYERVVKEWYMKLREKFMESLMIKFPNLNEDDAMNIYLDVFINIRKGLNDGIIDHRTDWEEYIITEGMKIVRDKYENDVNENTPDKIWIPLELLIQLPMIENEQAIYEDPRIHEILSTELMYTTEPYLSLIIFKYFYNLSSEEILTYFNEGDSSSYTSEKVEQLLSSGIDDLSKRVKKAVATVGLLN